MKKHDLTAMSIPRSIITLAWPVVLRLSLQMVVGIVDLAFVGSLGAAAIASVGLGNNLLWFIISATTAFSVGTTALVARHIGAKDPEQAEEVARQSIAVTFLVATVIGILSLIFSKQIMQLMISAMDTPDPLVILYGSTYFKIIAASFPFFFTQMVLNGILQGAGDTKTPLKIMFVINIFNIVFDYLLIFGIGPFPEMGVAGAALASTGARILAFVLCILVLAQGRTALKLRWPKRFTFDLDIIKQVVQIGLPAALQQLVTNGGTTFLATMVASLGTNALAANQIVMRGISIANMPAFGFSIAATTLVGQNLGAEKPDRAEKTGYVAAGMSGAFMFTLAVFIFIFAKEIALFFHAGPEVLELAVQALRVVSVTFPFMGILLTFAGGLRGAGDTMWVLIITIIGVWGTRLALALVLLNFTNMGFIGVWISYGLDFIVRAGLFYLRFRTGKWKEIKLRKPGRRPGRVKSTTV